MWKKEKKGKEENMSELNTDANKFNPNTLLGSVWIQLTFAETEN